MRIAIFGATSQIAKDLILSFNLHSNHDLVLYARRPDVVYEWLKTVGLADKFCWCGGSCEGCGHGGHHF
jgi:short-subunit dehydrogenase